MGQISIRLSDKDERMIKRLAAAEHKSLAEYCRYKILSEDNGEEKPLDRITVEMQIDKLTEQVNKLRRMVIYNAKQSIWYGEANKNFTTEFFKEGFDPERVAERWVSSSKAATDYVNELFK